MAEVYWIHLPEHTDMFTQGYIGITKMTAKKRFYRHLSASNSTGPRSQTILSKAIRKYGDNLIVETILICSLEYAFDIEKKLRPSTRVGWNTDHGGRGRTEVSQETKSKISKTLMGHEGVVHSDETKRKMSEKRKGVPRPDGMADKIRKTLISRGPWNKPSADHVVWREADRLYSLYTEGLGYRAATTRLNIPEGKSSTVFSWFQRGWVPNEDQSWLAWKGQQENT